MKVHMLYFHYISYNERALSPNGREMSHILDSMNRNIPDQTSRFFDMQAVNTGIKLNLQCDQMRLQDRLDAYGKVWEDRKIFRADEDAFIASQVAALKADIAEISSALIKLNTESTYEPHETPLPDGGIKIR